MRFAAFEALQTALDTAERVLSEGGQVREDAERTLLAWATGLRRSLTRPNVLDPLDDDATWISSDN